MKFNEKYNKNINIFYYSASYQLVVVSNLVLETSMNKFDPH